MLLNVQFQKLIKQPSLRSVRFQETDLNEFLFLLYLKRVNAKQEVKNSEENLM